MKLRTEVDMQPSEAATGKNAKATATSSSRSYPRGDSGNISVTPTPKSKSEILREMNDELANLLVMYAQHGGEITGVELPGGQKLFGSSFVLVLPADFDPELKAYSLKIYEQQEKINPQTKTPNSP